MQNLKKVFLIAIMAAFPLTHTCVGATQLIYPQIADGAGYKTALLLSSRSLSPTIVTVSFTEKTGVPLSVTIDGRTGSSHQVLIPALGSVKLETSGAAPTVATGWAKVTTDPPADIQGNVVFNLGYSAEASVPDAPPASYVDFVADEEGRFRTGFAIANPGTVAAVGTLTLRDADGSNPRSYSISRPPQTQEAKYIFEAIPGAHSGRAQISLTSGRASVTAVRFDTVSGTFSTVSVGYRSIYVSGTCADIQNAIDTLPPSGGQVIIEAGTYVCSKPIVVDQDNVDLRGQGPGTVLLLADGSNCPVIVIGQLVTPPVLTRRNIWVSDLVIDGNRGNQQFECMGGPCGSGGLTDLRNNGILVRSAEDVILENLVIHSARSGGLVTEKGCRRLTVQNISSSDNEFDGMAAYETEDSVFSGLNLFKNQAAGISLDINFNHNTVTNSTLSENGSVGIFMRYSRNNIFQGIRIRASGQYGVFLAQVDNDTAKPASGNTFSNLMVSESMLAGMRVNDESCINNIVCASQFVGNKGGSISEVRAGLVQSCTNIAR